MQYQSSSDTPVTGNQAQPLFLAALTILFLGFLTAIPFRVYLLMTAVDAKTGFYFPESPLVFVFNGLMLGLALLLFILPLFQRKVGLFANPAKSGVLAGIALLIAGLIITYASIFDLLNGWQQYLPLFSGALGTISGFLLIVTAFRLFRGGIFEKKVGVYLLIVPLWSCVRLLQEFMAYKTVAGVSERVLDIVTSCGGTLCLFFLVALLCGADSAGFHRLFVSSAAITALFGAVSNLPRLLIGLLGSDDLKQVLLAPHAVNAGLCVMAILLLIWYLTLAERDGVKVYAPSTRNTEVLPDYVEGEENSFSTEDWSEAQEMTTPTLMTAREAAVEPEKPEPKPEPEVDVDSILEELSVRPQTAEQPAEPAAEEEVVLEPLPEPEASVIEEAIAEEPFVPVKPVVDQEEQALPVNDEGYTILPTLAELEQVDWDLTDEDK